MFLGVIFDCRVDWLATGGALAIECGAAGGLAGHIVLQKHMCEDLELPEVYSWRILRVQPPGFIGMVNAPDEASAVTVAIDLFDISDDAANKNLVAERRY